MLTPTSNLDDLAKWVREKHYLSEETSKVESSHEFGILVDNTLTEEQKDALIGALNAAPFGSFVYKHGERSFVAACPIADTQLALKYYHRLSLRRQLGYTLWNTRCMRSWIAARAFYQLGIPTPQPIAIFEKKRLGFLADKALFVTRVAEGIPLPTYFKEHAHDADKMAKIAANCFQIFDQLAKYRIYHSDTAPKNFIIAPDCSVSIIDLDAVQLAMPEQIWLKKRKTDVRRFKAITLWYPHLAPLYKDLH